MSIVKVRLNASEILLFRVSTLGGNIIFAGYRFSLLYLVGVHILKMFFGILTLIRLSSVICG